MPTNQSKRSLGFIEQDPSPKDHLFQGVRAMPGATGDVDMRKWCSPVENQGPINSCVGNATCSALELLRIKNNLKHLDLSRLFTYYNARNVRGDAKRDIGSVIRFAFGTLNSIGSCAEAVWPYVTSRVLTKPSFLAYRNAYRARINKYEMIYGRGKPRIDACVNALNGGQPIVFGMNVTEQFMYPRSNDGRVTNGGSYIGAHAMLIVGYQLSKKQFIVKNSWGAQWGQGGYCYMPQEWLDDHNGMDMWVPFEAPNI